MGQRVISFGEIMIRLKPINFERFFQSPLLEATFGGGEANVAVSLANFGIDAAYVTVLPSNYIGNACIAELRRFGVYATAFSPNKGMDKHVRLNSVSPIFEAGHVWRPDTEWAEDLQEELASFPFGENDDLVDATTLALIRYREGNFVRLYDDDKEIDTPRENRTYEYY